MEGLELSPGFWRGRRVFLTGHTGFKGSWAALWLNALGAEVCGFALQPPTEPSLYEAARVGETLHSITGDLRDAAALGDAMAGQRPEVVVHMAAQALVRASYRDPIETYASNVMGTVHLLEAARHVDSVRAVLIVTSDKCYENREWVWGYRENEALGGHDPYSSSKACAEIVTAAYRDSFLAGSGVAVASVRAGNVIGGGDWAEDRLVPDLVRGFSAGAVVPIRNPAAVRPWQHVLEPLSGYLGLAERLCEQGASFAGAWNFGPRSDDARPVGWIARRAAELWGEGARWEADAGGHPHEAHYLRLDATKAGAELGWMPRLDLARALEWTLTWYRSVLDGADARAACEQQIDAYVRSGVAA